MKLFGPLAKFCLILFLISGMESIWANAVPLDSDFFDKKTDAHHPGYHNGKLRYIPEYQFQIDSDNNHDVFNMVIMGMWLPWDSAQNSVRLHNERKLRYRRAGLTRKVLVIGGGPVGQIAALELYRKGFEVTILEKRAFYSREQIVGLNTQTTDLIKKYIGDEKFAYLNKIGIFEYRPGWSKTRKNSQPFHSVRLQQLEYLLSIYIKELEIRDQSAEIKILRDHEYLDAPLKTEKGIVVKYIDHKSGKEHLERFDVVVGADGAKSKSAKHFGIRKHVVSRTKPAGVLMLKNPSGSHPNESLRYKVLGGEDGARSAHSLVRQTMLQLRTLGWKERSLPVSRIFMNGNIVYIAGEIPESLISDREGAITWFKILMQLHMPEEEILQTSELSHVDPLQIFPVVQVFANKWFVASESLVHSRPKRENNYSPSFYIALGDNAGTPHFLTSMGVNTGVSQALEVSETILAYYMRPREVLEQEISRIMKKSTDVLRDAAQSFDYDFYDGPFLEGLTDVEINLSNFLSHNVEENYVDIVQWQGVNQALESMLRDKRPEVVHFCNSFCSGRPFCAKDEMIEHMRDYIFEQKVTVEINAVFNGEKKSERVVFSAQDSLSKVVEHVETHLFAESLQFASVGKWQVRTYANGEAKNFLSDLGKTFFEEKISGGIIEVEFEISL